MSRITGRAVRTESGLYTAAPVMFAPRFREKAQTVVLPDGRRAKRWSPDGDSSVVQTETDESLDALVRPTSTMLFLRRMPDRPVFLKRLRGR